MRQQYELQYGLNHWRRLEAFTSITSCMAEAGSVAANRKMPHAMRRGKSLEVESFSETFVRNDTT